MKHKNHIKSKTWQSGNVLFLILIAIALFAAFTAAVTQSNSGGGEQAGFFNISATQIMRYGSTVKSAVDSLRQRGISESDISFANNIVSGYGTVGANPAGEVFHINGGGITYEAPNENWLDGSFSNQTGYGEWIFTARNMIYDVGTPIGSICSSQSCSELVAILPYIRQEICEEINENLGVPNIPTDVSVINFTEKFQDFDTGSIIGIGSSPTAEPTGRYNFCIEGGGSPPSGSYHYIQVLIAR